MPQVNTEWNLESVREVAEGKTYTELKRSFRSAFNWAVRNKQLGNIGLVRKYKWNVESVRELAQGQAPNEFKASNNSAYYWALRNKQIGNIGLVRKNKRWSLKEARKVAEGKTAIELYKSHVGAYDWARKNNQLDNIGLVKCKTSLMNRWGRELAEDMELVHSTEYTSPSCKHKYALKFDLAIHDHCKVKCLVEFQGRQHFGPERFGGITKEEALEKFNDQKYRDQVKRDWCAERGIPLIEINYRFKDKGEKVFKAELKRQLNKVGVFSEI